MASIKERALNIADLRDLARRRLPRGLFEFIDRGAEDDVAIRNNRAAFERYSFRPHVLTDVSKRSLATDIFGRPSSMPIVMAPTGAAGLVWHDGEVALARAAASAGVPFTLSTASLTSIERIAADAAGRLWFQLYMWPDRSMSHDLVRRVQKAGFEALVVTVDTAVTVNREFNARNGFTLPFKLNRRNFFDITSHTLWLTTVIMRYLVTTGMPRFENFPEALQRSLSEAPKGRSALPKNDSLTWDDFRDLRKIWQGPLIVKGLLHPDDAQAAATHGADAVIVSNHGGRNLDTAIAPLDALPDIVERVGSRIDVFMDGGIVRGSDVVKALALGAKAVLVGRAPLWGVACAGEAGAAYALSILRDEALRVMGQLGCPSVLDVGPEVLWNDSIALHKSTGEPPVEEPPAPARAFVMR
jgi:L-lactate dehydrogenase (cytochrome)/(S)-mandelate dehydrogenase